MPAPASWIPGDGRVITDFASIGKTNCCACPFGNEMVYFDVSSLVIVGSVVSLMRRSHFTLVLPSNPGSRRRIG